MIQEYKKLLLKDLCARLPYKTLIHIDGLGARVLNYADTDDGFINCAPLYAIKPYLRPMSSMTEEEREEWADLFMKPICELEQYVVEKEAQDIAPVLYGKSHSISIDWLNSHHFDYRGLIEKGLALEAPEDMYNLKNK